MKASLILSILFIEVVLPCTGFGASTELSAIKNGLLPWQIIAKRFCEGDFFCNKSILSDYVSQKEDIKRIPSVEPICNYAFCPYKPLVIRLPQNAADFNELKEIKVSVAEFIDGEWYDNNILTAKSESNEILFESGIGKEGFFGIRLAIVTNEGQKHHNEAYVIICSGWRKDILAFCRAQKEEIELAADEQLVRSTIAVSHFDRTMELISEASFLSGKILRALADALQSKKVFDSGGYPNFVVGLNKIRLRRYQGAPVEEFAVFIPDCYESKMSWPVLLHVGDTAWESGENYPSDYGLIDIWWHTVSHKEIRWKDYITIMALVEEKLNIDCDRIYIDGDCMDGISAIALVLHHPDFWAECSVSLGNSYRHLSANALNLPLMFVRGSHGTNQPSFTGYFNFALKCFQHAGCRYLKSSLTQEIAEVRGTPVPDAIRENNPQKVLYSIESLGYPKAYWVKIEGREDENLIATIDALISGQKISVNTRNIDAYSLNLSCAPLDSNESVEIIENGKSLGFVKEQIFTKRSKKYIDAIHIKNEHLHGPVRDAFMDPYVVVYGAEDEGLLKINRQVANSLANGGPVFTDSNVPKRLLDNHNLILVDMMESNLLLSRISKRLPVRIENGSVIAGDKHYDGSDTGFILIYPNPENVQRYVAVFSGTSPQAIAKIPEAYSQMKSIRPIDVGIFELTDSGNIKWHIFEKFNTVWDWHGDWDKVLFIVNKKHLKWQWQQWIAKVVKEQFKADVVVLENPLIFEDSVPVGQITYRDLFNTFESIWLSKVSMKGKALRALLTVPFIDISQRDTDALIVEGIKLISDPANSDEGTLTINELADDAVYTVVLPEKCLNGGRMGLVLQDYQIKDQDYLMPILKEFLENNVNADIDTQLDNLKFNVF